MSESNSSIGTQEGSVSSSSSISVVETVITPFDISELTSGSLKGDGVFDILTRTLKSHLVEEFSKGRITGPEYATAFSDMLVAALGQSIDYVSRRAILGYQIQGMENDNAYKLAQLEIAKEQLKKIPAEIASIEAETALTSARTQSEIQGQARIPVEIELLRKNSLKADADVLLAEKSVERMTAELTKIPLEKAILAKQADQLTSQIAQVDAATSKAVYELEWLLPIEKENTQKQGLQIAAQTLLTTEQTTLSKLQATTIPVDIDYKRAQIANMARQSIILEREASIKENELLLQAKRIEIAAIELEVQREELEVKKAQVLGQQAQSELYRQKVVTEKAQTDNSVIGVGSVIDLNNKVLEGQAGAFKFDAQNRTAKLLLDTFVTTYQAGEREVNLTNKLTDVDIGKVMGTMYTTIGAT